MIEVKETYTNPRNKNILTPTKRCKRSIQIVDPTFIIPKLHYITKRNLNLKFTLFLACDNTSNFQISIASMRLLYSLLYGPKKRGGRPRGILFQNFISLSQYYCGPMKLRQQLLHHKHVILVVAHVRL